MGFYDATAQGIFCNLGKGDVDFAAVARSFGAFGVRVTQSKDIEQALRDALADGGPALVDVVVSREAQSPSANRDKTRLV
jgi:thiamine pyrophosphate-dependent acetolactate synthase large subunit-like protein